MVLLALGKHRHPGNTNRVSSIRKWLDGRFRREVAGCRAEYMAGAHSLVPGYFFAGIGSHLSHDAGHGAQRHVPAVVDGLAFSNGGKQFVLFDLVGILFLVTVAPWIPSLNATFLQEGASLVPITMSDTSV